ncbi:hypothetical protein [Sphingobium yanoikuyae]|uniref:hypothetical protein n=1 Tax=Sphingobium yanoikuyae TaxID=13690 RepID=UPI0028B0B0DB|nr:hypothetical protein [Sphingobium yanoikuyae]
MQTTGFSGEYWNLHRNSLLFSSALFVVSISAKSGTFGIFGMTFEQVGTRAFVLLLAIAATYAIIAFLLEWQAECWPSVQVETTKLRDASRAIAESTTKMTNSLESVDSLIAAHRDLAGRLSENELPLRSQTIDDATEQALKMTREKAEKDFRITATQRAVPSEEFEKMMDDYMRSAENFSIYLRENALGMIVIAGKQFYDDISKLDQSLTDIKNDVAAAKTAMVRLPLQLVPPFSLSMTRGLLVAALVPGLAYVVAIAHALWQTGLHWFSSPLVAWLRG